MIESNLRGLSLNSQEQVCFQKDSPVSLISGKQIGTRKDLSGLRPNYMLNQPIVCDFADGKLCEPDLQNLVYGKLLWNGAQAQYNINLAQRTRPEGIAKR